MKCKVCKGTGIILEPRGWCNCGSGEGCSQHSDFWMQKKACPACAKRKRAKRRAATNASVTASKQ